MKTIANRRTLWAVAVLLLGAVLAAAPVAFAGKPALSAKKKVAGLKPDVWAAAWYQWAYSLPEAGHPFYDESGLLGHMGQHGGVWFLCGAYNETGTVVRDVEVPAGMPIFFPIVATQFDNWGVTPADSVSTLMQKASDVIDAFDPSLLFCEIDGVSLTDLHKRRIRTKNAFAYGSPPASLPNLLWDVDPGTLVYPAVQDGYWVMVKPFAPGKHKIEFGYNGGEGLTTNITYNLTVK